MKLRDLARSSNDPTSFLPALHIFLSRFWNRGTAARSRRPYESVSRSSSAPRFLTLMQQTVMVPLRSILRPPRRPGTPDTIPIRAHREDRNFCPRTCHIPASLCFLILEQNQSKVYREVLIAGDLSQDDLTRADTQVVVQVSQLWMSFGPPVLTPCQSQGVSRIWPASPYGGSASGTTEFVYGNDTVYFAQPSLSQFVPGGSGTGAFRINQTVSISPNDTPNNTLGSGDESTPENNAGVVLRYASPPH